MTDTVIFTANRGYSLTSSRFRLIQAFLDSGWHVVLATAEDDESRQLVKKGATLEPVVFNRGGLFLGKDAKAYYRLVKIYGYYRPTLIHNFNAKPVILGSIAARHRLNRSVRLVNTITGLGHAFLAGGLVTWLAGIGYRIALPETDATIFQNPDDQQLFIKHRWVKEKNSRLIIGSGIDVDHFKPPEMINNSKNAPILVMLARLLGQKGISEVIEVARRIKQEWPEARFIWAGESEESHPDGVSSQWMSEQTDIEYLGRVEDVRALLNTADILLFPSSYREGVPRVVMEAAATGLPTVGFDVPGVREAVRDGDTGFLVPVKDVNALTSRVSELLNNAGLRLQMGEAARALALESFDRKAIEQQHFALYRELGVQV